MNDIYCNICSKSPKGLCRELTLFTFNILKILMHVTFKMLKIQMDVKIEHKHIKRRKNKKKKQTNKNLNMKNEHTATNRSDLIAK